MDVLFKYGGLRAVDGKVVAINSRLGNLAPSAETNAFQRYAAYLVRSQPS